MGEQNPSRGSGNNDQSVQAAGMPVVVPGQQACSETAPQQPMGTSRVLIFVPGLGWQTWNTAERVADVIAGALSRTRAGTYTAERSTTATVPRSLRVGKVIRSPDGQPLVEVVELDYRHHLDDIDPDTGEPARPLGFVRTCLLAIVAGAKVTRAAAHPAKTGMAKLQLLLGFGCVAALFVTAAVAAVAALTAMGLSEWLPSWLTMEEGAAQTTAIAAGGSVAVVWQFIRARALQLSRTLRCLERYVDDGRHRCSVTQVLDTAVDGLRDTRGQGLVIDVFAYSFGSVLAVDALFPEEPVAPSRLDAVASLTTAGCPADMIRLFAPHYYDRQSSRSSTLRWVNVYIPADVFGSTFDNHPNSGRGLERTRFCGHRVMTARVFGSFTNGFDTP